MVARWLRLTAAGLLMAAGFLGLLDLIDSNSTVCFAFAAQAFLAFLGLDLIISIGFIWATAEIAAIALSSRLRASMTVRTAGLLTALAIHLAVGVVARGMFSDPHEEGFIGWALFWPANMVLSARNVDFYC